MGLWPLMTTTGLLPCWLRGRNRVMMGRINDKDNAMLELRPNCERCDDDLPPESAEARICSFECTFCARCASELHDRCPNCSGELLRRPIRPAAALMRHPASTKRYLAAKG